MARELKNIVCAQLDRDFEGLDGCVLIDYAGLNSEQTYDLRSKLRADGVRVRVVHNRLAKRVFGAREDIPAEFADLFKGPVALLVAEEGALVASKSITNWHKENKDLAAIKGGLFEGCGHVTHRPSVPCPFHFRP